MPDVIKNLHKIRLPFFINVRRIEFFVKRQSSLNDAGIRDIY